MIKDLGQKKARQYNFHVGQIPTVFYSPGVTIREKEFRYSLQNMCKYVNSRQCGR